MTEPQPKPQPTDQGISPLTGHDRRRACALTVHSITGDDEGMVDVLNDSIHRVRTVQLELALVELIVIGQRAPSLQTEHGLDWLRWQIASFAWLPDEDDEPA